MVSNIFFSKVLVYAKYLTDVPCCFKYVRGAAPRASSCLAPTPRCFSAFLSLPPHAYRHYFFPFDYLQKLQSRQASSLLMQFWDDVLLPCDRLQSLQTGTGVVSAHISWTLKSKLPVFCFLRLQKCSSRPQCWHTRRTCCCMRFPSLVNLAAVNLAVSSAILINSL